MTRHGPCITFPEQDGQAAAGACRAGHGERADYRAGCYAGTPQHHDGVK
ncbi:hypothetical protein [Enterobacter ludwigii]|nr:hypothetical protein [Enterobacter ludwigii]